MKRKSPLPRLGIFGTLGEAFFDRHVQKCLMKRRMHIDPAWPLRCFNTCNDFAYLGVNRRISDQPPELFGDLYQDDPEFVSALLVELTDYHLERRACKAPLDERIVEAANIDRNDPSAIIRRARLIGGDLPSLPTPKLLSWQEVAEIAGASSSYIQKKKVRNITEYREAVLKRWGRNIAEYLRPLREGIATLSERRGG